MCNSSWIFFAVWLILIFSVRAQLDNPFSGSYMNITTYNYKIIFSILSMKIIISQWCNFDIITRVLTIYSSVPKCLFSTRAFDLNAWPILFFDFLFFSDFIVILILYLRWSLTIKTCFCSLLLDQGFLNSLLAKIGLKTHQIRLVILMIEFGFGIGA